MTRLITIEFTIPETERDKVAKLVAAARRLGITSHHADSFEPEEVPLVRVEHLAEPLRPPWMK